MQSNRAVGKVIRVALRGIWCKKESINYEH